MAGNNVSFGAIRWDCWYSDFNEPLSTRRSLSDPLYQGRAPFFSQQLAPNYIRFNHSAATMSQEIAFAKNNGLDFWSFLYYGGADPTTSSNFNATLAEGWKLYQANPNKNDMKWCWMMYPAGLANGATNLSRWSQMVDIIVTHMQQSNYKKVLTNRPLYQIYWDAGEITGWWQNNIANYKTALDALRSRAQSAGLGNPYITFYGISSADEADFIATGADAACSYISRIPAAGYDKTYAALDTSVRGTWDEQAGNFGQVIPTCMMGWDTRPRVNYPVGWANDARPYFRNRNYHAPATNEELVTHLQACVDWIDANPTACPTRTALIYAWNEHDEGGWMCPTLSDPNGSRLAFLKTTLEL
jgi:hypothetical protein